MVQIIKGRPGFGAQIGAGLGAGLAQGVGQQLQGHQQRQSELVLAKGKSNIEQQERTNKLTQFKELFGEQEGVSDFGRKVLQLEAAGIIPAGTGKSLMEMERQREARTFSQSLFEPEAGQGGITQPSPQGVSPTEEMPQVEKSSQGKGQKQIPKTKLEAMPRSKLIAGLQDEHLSPVFQAEIDRRDREEDISRKVQEQEQHEKEFGHKETGKFAETLVDNADQAREMKHALGDLRGALKKKATGASARNLAFKYLSNKKSPYAGFFQTKDTQAVINAQKALSGGFRNLFGSKPTEREFFWYENILPDLLKSPEVNESVANYFERTADLLLDGQKYYDEIVKKNKGYRPLDIDVQIREKLQPKIDKLINEGHQLSGYQLVRGPDGVVRQIPLKDLEEALSNQGTLVE